MTWKKLANTITLKEEFSSIDINRAVPKKTPFSVSLFNREKLQTKQSTMLFLMVKKANRTVQNQEAFSVRIFNRETLLLLFLQ